MMKEFDSLKERIDNFNQTLTTLYFGGSLKLSELKSFREILAEIKSMLNKLESFSFFGFIPSFVRRDLNRLSSEMTLMEYNVSLIAVNKAACRG